MATWANLIFFHLFLLLCLLLLSCSELVVSHSVVESLPGFPGPLPFELETGYIGVGESEDVQLFYYFVKSESNPKEEPLLLWLTGGPGCSSFSAFAYEIGPLSFKPVQEDEGIPTLILNPFSWSKVASIIFLDLPVGTGFSYGRTSCAFQSTDLQACDQTYQFMRKWLADHPEFLSNPFYVGGDSYSGITVPIIVQVISNGNEAGIDPLINLKGYILGNPSTNHVKERNYDIPFAHGMGLISDELYESLQISCQGDYFNPKNAQCSQDIQAYYKCTLGIQLVHILEPVCHSSSLRQHEFFDKGRSLTERNVELDVPEPASPCAHNRDAQYLISARWLNNDTVREALHIQKGSIWEWIRCNYRLSYMTTTWSSYQYHVNLSSKGYRSLIYSGDHDLVVPFLGTQAWIRSLNYSIVDDWRSWIAEGQVAGWVMKIKPQFLISII